jgi:hypothetical protein
MATPTQGSNVPLVAAVTGAGSLMDAQRQVARSQYLAQALAALNASAQQPIRGGFGELGAKLLAEVLLQRGKIGADQKVLELQRQAAANAFPNDPRAQFLYLSNPGEMTKAQISRYYSPIDVRGGNTVLNAPTANGQFTAPVMHDDNGVYSTQTPNGVTVTPVDASQVGASANAGMRPMNYNEMLTQLQREQQGQQIAEQTRHNKAQEGIEEQKIPIEIGMLGAALKNANSAAQTSNVGASNSPNFAPPPGFVIMGPH